MNKLLKNIKDNDVIVFTNEPEFNYISKYYLNNGYEWREHVCTDTRF